MGLLLYFYPTRVDSSQMWLVGVGCPSRRAEVAVRADIALLPGGQLADMNSLEQAEGNPDRERHLNHYSSLPDVIPITVIHIRACRSKGQSFKIHESVRFIPQKLADALTPLSMLAWLCVRYLFHISVCSFSWPGLGLVTHNPCCTRTFEAKY